jgi:hypothetical protein
MRLEGRVPRVSLISVAVEVTRLILVVPRCAFRTPHSHGFGFPMAGTWRRRTELRGLWHCRSLTSMSFTGTVENGVIKLPADAALPNGTKVWVEPIAQSCAITNGHWQFPEAHQLGQFGAPVEDWRLLANENTA